MKKISIMLVIILAFFLLTACGGGKTSGGGNKTSTGKSGAAVGNIDEAPCDCCTECNKDICECEEDCDCNNCKCCAGGGSEGDGSFTYIVEFYAYVAGWRPIHKTFGTATVTMDQKNETGYFGSAPGAGDYQEGYIPETGQVETTFDFTAYLKDYDPKAADSITVGLNRIGAKQVTNYAVDNPGEMVAELPDTGNIILYALCSDYLDASSDRLDMDTWIYYFSVPMEDGIGYKVFNFDRADAEFEGHLELSIHVNPVR